MEKSVYSRLVFSLRMPGRSIAVECCSTEAELAFEVLFLTMVDKPILYTTLDAMKKDDLELIELLPSMSSFGYTVIKNFHLLSEATKKEYADLSKALADDKKEDSQLVLVGIGELGKALITHAPDLLNRIEIIDLR